MQNSIEKTHGMKGLCLFSQTKALQGFFAICIMLHHIGQKTCAYWLNPKYIVHGLDVFVPIGYFFVGIFCYAPATDFIRAIQKNLII